MNKPVENFYLVLGRHDVKEHTLISGFQCMRNNLVVNLWFVKRRKLNSYVEYINDHKSAQLTVQHSCLVIHPIHLWLSAIHIILYAG